MPHIVHATDFSPGSEVAFAHALAIALVHRARLTLIHVGGPGDGPVDWELFPGVRPRLAAWGLLPEGADRRVVARELGVDVYKTAVPGKDAADGVLTLMEVQPADLLVLGHEGHTGGWEIFRRSTSRTLARKAGAPVLVVPGGTRGFVSLEDGSLSIRRVLCPVDVRPDPRPAILAAAELLRDMATPGCEVDLFHAGDAEPAPHFTQADLPGATILRHSNPGDPATEILERAAETGPDLIIMASEGRHGLVDMLYGSVSEQVLRAARSPVLCVPV
ncbi:MAG: universal stress protein [Pseudomonadota bacterium]